MKRLLFLSGLLTSIVASHGQGQWAGTYLGLANPTTWTAGVTPNRSYFRMVISGDGSVVANEYNFAGTNIATYSAGYLNSAGRSPKAVIGNSNMSVTISAAMGAYGVYKGTFVTAWTNDWKVLPNGKVKPIVCKVTGTINAYRENVLPR